MRPKTLTTLLPTAVVLAGSIFLQSELAANERRIETIDFSANLDKASQTTIQARVKKIREILKIPDRPTSSGTSSEPSTSSGPKLTRQDRSRNVLAPQFLALISEKEGWSTVLFNYYGDLTTFEKDAAEAFKPPIRQEIESILFLILAIGTERVDLPEGGDLSKQALINPQSFMLQHSGKEWSKLSGLGLSDKAVKSILDYRALLTHALISQAREEMSASRNYEEVVDLSGAWAGSDDPTSDIDVNLKGRYTEDAVAILNKNFRRAFGQGLESGIVWDINFYAKDFLPSPPKAVTDIATDERERVSGWRPDVEVAILAETTGVEITKKTQAALLKLGLKDRQTELTMSLVRVRIDMNDQDWEKYKVVVKAEKSLKSHLGAYFTKAEAEYKARGKKIAEELKKVDLGKGATESAKAMAAENRVYELVLKEVASLRKEFDQKSAKPQPENAQPEKALLEAANAYVSLRAKLSEACMYANEAYLTPASVVGVVANKQMLSRDFKDKEEKPQLRKLELSPHEHYQMMNEQFGRIFHQVDVDHADPALALRRSGKYIHRFFNAAKQLTRATEPQADPKVTTRNKIDVPFSELQVHSRELEGLKKGRTIEKQAASGGAAGASSSVTKFPKLGEDVDLDVATSLAARNLFGESVLEGKGGAAETVDLERAKAELLSWKLNLDKFYWENFGKGMK